jgi:hypothetical protein
MTENGTAKRRLVERLAIGILIGVVAVSVGGAALLTVYLNRIGDAADGLNRAEGLGAYEGRPTPVVVDGVNALNYLLLATDDQGVLQAVLIAHLSSSRSDLTLVALPSDLVVDNGSGPATLASSFAADPRLAARAVENLTGARMDHQVRLGLHGFAGVVDMLGGLDLDGARLDGSQVIARFASASGSVDRSVFTAEVLRAALARANLGVAIADPNRFDKVMDALTPCLTVDAALTGDEIRSTLVESRVRADQVRAWPLASVPAGGGSAPEPADLDRLRSALAVDAFAAPDIPVPGATPDTSLAGTGAPTLASPVAPTPVVPSTTGVDASPTATAGR